MEAVEAALSEAPEQLLGGVGPADVLLPGIAHHLHRGLINYGGGWRERCQVSSRGVSESMADPSDASAQVSGGGGIEKEDGGGRGHRRIATAIRLFSALSTC